MVEAVAPPAVNPAIFAPLDQDWPDDEDDAPPEPDPEPMPEDDTDPSLLLELRPVTDQDVDRLWDWVRQDEDRGAAFLTAPATTSRALHEWFWKWAVRVTEGRAFVYAIDQDGGHCGFVILNPLFPQQAEAVCHLYLAPSVRGQAQAILPALLKWSAVLHPTLSLAVVTSNPAMMRLCRSCGFTVTYLLRRKAGG